MAVGAGHLAVIGGDAGLANGISKLAYRLRRKQPVGTDAHKAEPRLDAPERLQRRRAAAQRVPRIHCAQNGEIRIGVEALDESPALQVEIAGNIKTAADQSASLVIQTPGVF